MMMKDSLTRWVVTLALVGAALLGLVLLPSPIEGNWQTNTIGCMCDSHHFLRFEDGKVVYMSEHHPPPEWIGTYERIGWGRYNVNLFYGDASGVVSPRLLFLDISGVLKTTWRDFAFWKTRHVLDDPAQQVMEDAGSWNITVRHMDGKALYYFNDNEINLNGAEIVVTRLTREVMKKDESFVVYTDPEGIPAALLTILQELGVDYEERPYQLLLRTR